MDQFRHSGLICTFSDDDFTLHFLVENQNVDDRSDRVLNFWGSCLQREVSVVFTIVVELQIKTVIILF